MLIGETNRPHSTPFQKESGLFVSHVEGENSSGPDNKHEQIRVSSNTFHFSMHRMCFVCMFICAGKQYYNDLFDGQAGKTLENLRKLKFMFFLFWIFASPKT